jgi:hypothetical protein
MKLLPTQPETLLEGMEGQSVNKLYAEDWLLHPWQIAFQHDALPSLFNIAATVWHGPNTTSTGVFGTGEGYFSLMKSGFA